MTSSGRTEQIYDVLGVGFGPANLAVSVAIAEHNASLSSSDSTEKKLSCCFVENHPKFDWHPGMMLQGSRMQISFLKDLATMRSPTSPYTFLSYLHEQDRLATFINRSTFAPTRREYADYMGWAAKKVINTPGTGVQVAFGEWVEDLEPVYDSVGEIYAVRLLSKDRKTGEKRVRVARNLVVSAGGTPSIPQMFQSAVSQNRNVIHTAHYLTKVDEILKRVVKTHSVDVSSSKGVPGAPISPPESISSSRNGSVSGDLLNLPSSPAPISSSLAAADTSKLREALLSSLGEKPSDQPVRIAVIGGGQSSAECFLNLRSRLADALPQEILARGRPEIHLIIRKGALHPSDDSPFSNEIFDPAMTTYYHNLSLEGESSRPGLGFGKVSGRESSASRRGSSSTATPDEVVEGRKRILAEAKSTNYAVVNPVTLEAVYEALYEQRVEEDISNSNGPPSSASAVSPLRSDPKLVILPYREISAVSSIGRDRTKLSIIQSLRPSEPAEEVTYDAVVLGTGYYRQAWKGLLFPEAPSISQGEREPVGKGLRDVFGRVWEALYGNGPPSQMPSPKIRPARASPSDPPSPSVDSDVSSPEPFQLNDSPDSQANGSPSTPATSLPGSRSSSKTRIEEFAADVSETEIFGVKRNYRLNLPQTYRTPSGKEAAFRPTIWLQGSNESTHGISDSLLSVLAIRSGEVVQSIVEEGWFGSSA